MSRAFAYEQGAPALWAGMGAVGAAAFAAAFVASPTVALLLLALAATVAVVLANTTVATLPRMAGVAALVVLTIYPPKVFGTGTLAAPEVTKVAILACLAPAILLRGLDLRSLAPVLVLPALAITSMILGQPPASLTITQTVSSLVTLGLGWVALAIRWRRTDTRPLLMALALLAPLSVVLGVLMSAAGMFELFRDQGVARLSGAQIAANLGGLAAAGIAAAIVLTEMRGGPSRRVGIGLILLNWLILGATASRGPLLVAIMLSVPWLWLIFRRQLSASGPVAAARFAVGLTVLAVGSAAVAPMIQARNETQVYNESTGTVGADPTSGRLTAWGDFLTFVEPTPYFGLGIGAGPILEIGEDGFKAQHNEYLRALLEVGAVGLIVLLTSVVIAFRRVLRRVPRGFPRAMIGWQIGAFAFYSFTDNTLSSPYLSVPFLLLIGLAAAAVRRPIARSGASHTAARPIAV